jgi:ADP-ribose pyrophosphatase YjhB (NUDIX family)
MKILKEIRDRDIGLPGEERYKKPYYLRKATRAIIFDDRGRISFQFVSNHNYHILPGGGVEKGESVRQALARECLEESGCRIEIKDEVGVIIEYRNRFNNIQISYCFLAKAIGPIGRPKYEKKEIKEGMIPLWVTIEEAMELIKKDRPDNYQGKFTKIRDGIFLKEALLVYKARR